MRRLRRTLISIGVVIVVLGFMAAYRLYNKPHRNVAEASFQVITAARLVDAFVTDESMANEKYLDQVVQVQGVVESIEKNQSGETILVLGTDDPMSTVRCTLAAGQPPVDNGDDVTVRGICTGFLADVIVNRAIVIPGI